MYTTIRKQLTFTICSLILATLLAMLILSYSLLANDYEENIRHNNYVTADSLAANITQFMKSAYEINFYIANYVDVGKMDTARQQELLQYTVRQYPIFQLMAIVDAQGNQLVRSSGAVGNRAERDWFKRFMRERQPFISETYYSLTSESPVTTIVHGTYADSQLTGMVMADIETQKLQQMLEDYTVGTDSYAYLLDDGGTVVAHPDRQQVAELYNYKTMQKRVLRRDAAGKMIRDEKNNEITDTMSFPVTPSLQAIVSKAMAGEVGTGSYLDLQGEEYFCAYRAITLPGTAAPWSLIVVQKKNTAMAFVGQVAGKSLLAGLFIMVLATLLAMRFAWKITSPLHSMLAATNRVKDGDLQVRLIGIQHNEFDVVFANFNQMVNELRQHREGLEQLVAKRTDTLLLRERQYGAITGLLTQAGDETKDILDSILQNAAQLLGADAGFIGMFRPEEDIFLIKCSINMDDTLTTSPMPVDTGMHGEVYQSGELLYVEDYRTYARRINEPSLAPVVSVIMLPLKQGDAVRGVLTLIWKELIHPVDNDNMAALKQFGDLASLTLERDRDRRQMRHMAFSDALTGLPNRASLKVYLERQIQAQQNGWCSRILVMVIDLDDLKTINDNFGHSAGDQIIISAGNQIQEEVGEDGLVVRMGGDEFIAVVPEEESHTKMTEFADRILKKLCIEYEVASEKFHMSASIGMAFYPEDGDSADDLLKKADLAMYAAKQNGKNGWRRYDESLLEDSHRKMILTKGLRHALERKELHLLYQPQIDAATEQIIGFEALLRWHSPEHGNVTPAQFIPLAEHSGLILPIGQWVMQEACNFAASLAERGRGEVHVAVNVSTRQVLAENFIEMIRCSIEAAGIQASQLKIEITESMFMDSMEECVSKLCQVRDMGVDIAVDDFGVGYSSLTYLRQLPLAVLKIDKAFVDKVTENERDQHLVGSIINVAHALEMYVIAEGVETREQLTRLRQLGCDGIQGYLFSRPLLPDQALARLENNNEAV